jgi:hypothetical protein
VENRAAQPVSWAVALTRAVVVGGAFMASWIAFLQILRLAGGSDSGAATVPVTATLCLALASGSLVLIESRAQLAKRTARRDVIVGIASLMISFLAVAIATSEASYVATTTRTLSGRDALTGAWLSLRDLLTDVRGRQGLFSWRNLAVLASLSFAAATVARVRFSSLSGQVTASVLGALASDAIALCCHYAFGLSRAHDPGDSVAEAILPLILSAVLPLLFKLADAITSRDSNGHRPDASLGSSTSLGAGDSPTQ